MKVDTLALYTLKMATLYSGEYTLYFTVKCDSC